MDNSNEQFIPKQKHFQKLTDKQASEIRRLAGRREYTQAQLAKMYGVSLKTIQDIRFGRTHRR